MLIPIGEKDLVAVREQAERKVATPSELPLAVFHADVAPADRRPLVIDNVAFRSQTTGEHGARQLILQVNLADRIGDGNAGSKTASYSSGRGTQPPLVRNWR